MFAMTGLEFIICIIVVSLCVSSITGILVYRILKKKNDEQIDRLQNRIWMFEDRFFQVEDEFVIHMKKYH
jgi:septation ring formation regulator EzrA